MANYANYSVVARVCEEVPYLLLLANLLIVKDIIKIIPFFHRKPYFSSRRYKERRFSPSGRAVLAMLPPLATKARYEHKKAVSYP